MATLVISQKLSADVLYGGGIAVGLLMLVLSLTGLLEKLAQLVPQVVVRGLQLGLALQLGLLALKDYISPSGAAGYALALLSFVLILALQRRRLPAALVVMALGVGYALTVAPDSQRLWLHALEPSLNLPKWHAPTWSDIEQGFVVLALPQIALSIGNSILATEQIARDLFPEKALTVKRIGLTYSIMNLIAPFLSGVPTCHGAGGLAGHYAFGARTGGSVVLYGSFYLIWGLFFAECFEMLLRAFPLPILGVVLLFEAVALFGLVHTHSYTATHTTVLAIVAFAAIGLPFGFLVGLIAGTAVFYAFKLRNAEAKDRL
ncbi:MAG: molybdate transporter family protein [Chloroherpetonaceae bacterium]|nr:molybdate transporter family protein [Chloroherpetonaceae bacterium]